MKEINREGFDRAPIRRLGVDDKIRLKGDRSSKWRNFFNEDLSQSMQALKFRLSKLLIGKSIFEICTLPPLANHPGLIVDFVQSAIHHPPETGMLQGHKLG